VGLKLLEPPPPPDGATGPTAYLNCILYNFHFGIFPVAAAVSAFFAGGGFLDPGKPFFGGGA